MFILIWVLSNWTKKGISFKVSVTLKHAVLVI